MRNKQERGCKFTSREVVHCLNLQKGELKKLAKMCIMDLIKGSFKLPHGM